MDTIFLFDLDGTLVNTVSQISSVLSRTLAQFQVPTESNFSIENLVGLPLVEMLKPLRLPLGLENRIITRFREQLSTEIILNTELFDGALEALGRIKSCKFQIGVATSKPQTLANLTVESSDLKKFVDHVQGTDNFPAKPHPEVINRALLALHGSSGVMFGDRIEDIIAGKNAGLRTIGLAQTSHNKEELRRAGADMVFNNFRELLASTYFEKLLVD